jgi:TorA maturation chaperone TorD
VLVEDHDRVFGLVISKECPPLETEYCPQTFSIYRSQRLADIAGFYHAFGVEPGRDVPERADHIACELEFLAWLVAKERHAMGQDGAQWKERARTSRDAQRTFFEEHLAWWVPAFARALGLRAGALTDPAPLQSALAAVLASWVPLERALLGVAPPTELVGPRSEVVGAEDACSGCGVAEQGATP